MAGMCRKPFGGERRLDRFNVMDGYDAGSPREKLLYLDTIRDAVHNYKFGFLGRNGTSVQEFAWAYEYLFQIRSNDPDSWPDRLLPLVRGHEVVLTPSVEMNAEEIRQSCFDVHYDLAYLSPHYNLERFCHMLKKNRRELLEQNLEQVREYVTSLQLREWKRVAPGCQTPLKLASADLVEVLTDPGDLFRVADLVYLPKQYHRPCRAPLSRPGRARSHRSYPCVNARCALQDSLPLSSLPPC